MEWSKQFQWFRFDAEDPLNFAAAWIEWELEFPCPPTERRKWPAFSPTGDHRPATAAQLAAQHRQLTVHALGEAAADGRPPHAYRATLATAMAAARASGRHPELSDAVIQMHLRWKSVESLMSYMKIRPHTFANNIAIATATETGLNIRDDVPIHEPNEIYEDLLQALEVLDSTGPGKKRAAAETATADTSATASAPAIEEAPTTLDYEIEVVGRTHTVTHAGDDSWGLIGEQVTVPNELWGYDDGEATECTIKYFLGKYDFGTGKSQAAYTISPFNEPDINYPVRADYVLRQVSAKERRRLSKISKLPTAIKRA